jgi:hypothetical protein
MKVTRVQRVAAWVAAFAVMIPVMPFYFMAELSDRAQTWAWPAKLCDLADRIIAQYDLNL